MQFRVLEAEWDEDNLQHIAQHGVDPEEVEEVVYEDLSSVVDCSWSATRYSREAMDGIWPDVQWSLLSCSRRAISAQRRLAGSNRQRYGAWSS